MASRVDATGATVTITTQGAAEQEFKAVLSKAVASNSDPAPKPQEPPSDRGSPGSDIQPMDPSRPDLWIGGPPADPGSDKGYGSGNVVPPPDDWQSNPGDVWNEPHPGVTYA